MDAARRVGIAFDLPAPVHIVLRVYTIDGRNIRLVLDQPFAAGRHVALWDGRDAEGKRMPDGVYFARLWAGTSAATRRVLMSE